MDHIITPGHDPWPEEVPYLLDPTCPYVYDNGPWTGFPQRMGWSIDELKQTGTVDMSKTPGHTKELAASVLQAWLFFGLIHRVTNIPINIRDFVKGNANGKAIITTQNLPRYLDLWRGRLHGMSGDEVPKYVRNLDVFLFDVFENAFRLTAERETSVLVPSVKYSMTTLWATLVAVKLKMFPDSVRPLEPMFPSVLKPLEEHLIKKKWCPTDILRLNQSISRFTQYYMGASVPRLSTRDHSNCDHENCRALQQVDKQYSPRHAHSGCSCDLIAVDGAMLRSMANTRSWPILAFSDSGNLQAVPVHTTRVDTPYIAISHVWADGLGNPKSNEMYRCQVTRIQNQVGAVAAQLSARRSTSDVQKVHFWIDTLCVPAEDTPEKKIAISLMEAVYKNADAVLVLDSDLQLVDDSCSPAQIAIAIAASVWFTRLWTIQEAAFARELFFQLKTHATQEATLRKTATQSNDSWSSEAMIVDDALKKMRLLDLSFIRAAHGVPFLRSMNWRFTTRAEDEVICLAILLGFTEKQIVALSALPQDPVQRLRRFMLEQKYLPGEILFWHFEPSRTSREDGFAWAPKSFLARRGSGLAGSFRDLFENAYSGYLNSRQMPSLTENYVDEQGFHVRHAGLALPAYLPDDPNDTKLFFRIEDLSVSYLAAPFQDMLEKKRPWETLRKLKRPAIIVARPPEDSTGNSLKNGFQLAAFVERIGNEDEGRSEILCVYNGRILLYYLGKIDPSSSDMGMTPKNTLSTQSLGEVRWCIR